MISGQVRAPSKALSMRLKQWLWFVALWAAGVVTVAGAAWIIKALLAI